MSTWSLAAGRPVSLTLAADARQTSPDYSNDHIWRLHLFGGEPPALALQTTYGLRARSMRLFPRFVRQGQAISDPADFRSPPVVETFYPNYVCAVCYPYQGMRVQAEYWIPDSHVATGRLKIRNENVVEEAMQLEWVSLLVPMGTGSAMSVGSIEHSPVLHGQTGSLFPVCFLTGAPRPASGPFPALAFDLAVEPGAEVDINWALASESSPEESFETAHQTVQRPWEAEVARLEMQNSSQSVEVSTGNPDWDAAFALSQKAAFGLFFPPSEQLPASSFVLNREPEQGYSIRGDGSDYPFSWNGQTSFDAYALASVLLPGGSELLKGVLENFLAVQETEGSIDWKPGLAGQRAQRLAQPLLAALACRIHDHLPGPDPEWVSAIFPGLLRFFRVWLSPQQDVDQDGMPEWNHPLQSGLEDIPLFDRWHPGAQGVDSSVIESPALAAMLYNECRCLQTLALLAGAADILPWLEEQAFRIRRAIDETWDERSSLFRYRDRESHSSLAGETLLEFTEPGSHFLNKRWVIPRRLQLFMEASDQNTYAMQVTVRGRTGRQPVEESIPARSMYWNNGQARATTQHVFTHIDSFDIWTQVNIKQGQLRTVDYTQEDVSLLLPLWAQAASPAQAQRLVENTIQNGLLQPAGMALCHPRRCPDEPLSLRSVSMPWNLLIGEGLLRYDYRQLAADLVTRLMTVVVKSLVENQSFRQLYDADSGSGRGDANALSGLAPLGLFLQTLGLRSFCAQRLVIEGYNPFPWPVTVKYRGTVLLFQAEETVVTFPNRQPIILSGPGPHSVSLG